MNAVPQKNLPAKLPLYLREQAEMVARLNGVSLNHFVTNAIEERIERLLFLEQQRILRDACAHGPASSWERKIEPRGATRHMTGPGC